MIKQAVFLVGARCCGKTTVGRVLAQRHDMQFVDTDHWLLKTTQMTVAQLVAQEGWSGFRARESQALRAVSTPLSVIATGGGMVLSPDNRQFMRDTGVVFYLSAPAAVLARRLASSPEQAQRPSLTGLPVDQEVAQVLAARDGLYRQAAHYLIDASPPALQIAEQIERLLASRLSAERGDQAFQ